MTKNSYSSIGIKSEDLVVPQKQVFLSYSHRDLRYAKRLRVHLGGCQQATSLTIWDDSQIQAGSLWKREITSALASACFAVLLSMCMCD